LRRKKKKGGCVFACCKAERLYIWTMKYQGSGWELEQKKSASSFALHTAGNTNFSKIKIFAPVNFALIIGGGHDGIW